jgi:hypothetical protein
MSDTEKKGGRVFLRSALPGDSPTVASDGNNMSEVGSQAKADQLSATESMAAPAMSGAIVEDVRPKNKFKENKEVQNIEQFIAVVYARKGQRVSLKPKIERVLSQQPRLSVEGRARLMDMAKGDALLAVPRQILLIAREIVGFPVLSSELKEFVRDVLRAHPAFQDRGVVASLNNLPDAPALKDAIAKIASIGADNLPPSIKKKDAGLVELRRNCVYTLVLWCSESRGMRPNEVAELLLGAYWGPEAIKVSDPIARLRALTDVHDSAALGLASVTLQEEVERQARFARDAKAAESTALGKLAQLEAEFVDLNSQIAEKDQTIDGLREAQVAEEKKHREELSHLRDDFEQMRGLVLRQLKADITLLEEGLHAANRTPPKLNVTIDHVERVLEALRREIEQLEPGD